MAPRSLRITCGPHTSLHSCLIYPRREAAFLSLSCLVISIISMSSRKISALIINQLMRNLHSETGDEPVNYFDDIDSCYHDDGTLDWDRLEDFLGREDEEDTAKQHYLLTLMCLCASAKMESARSLNHKKAINTPRVKKSRKRRPKYFVDPSTGKKRKLTPTLSLWWILYLQNPQPNCTRWSQTFRNRFRLPYQSYLDLLSMLKDEDDEGLFCRCLDRMDRSTPEELPSIALESVANRTSFVGKFKIPW